MQPTQPQQPSLVVIYHSNFGHTRRVAQAIATSAGTKLNAYALDIDVLDEAAWQLIDEAKLLVFGSAVYMGSVTAAFKAFMDSTSGRWFHRTWQGKLAAGFANSGGLSGDKLAVLQQLCLFAMQHGMHWVGMPLMPTGHSEQDLNRLSGFLGLMTQSLDISAEETPCVGDMNSAYWFGDHLAQTVLDYQRGLANLA